MSNTYFENFSFCVSRLTGQESVKSSNKINFFSAQSKHKKFIKLSQKETKLFGRGKANFLDYFL